MLEVVFSYIRFFIDKNDKEVEDMDEEKDIDQLLV